MGRYLARLPRRKALVDERLFGIDHTPGHEVLIAVIFRRGGHLDGPRDKEQPRSRQVAQLPAGLHDDVDARTPQFPGGDEPQVAHPSEDIADGLHAQHVEHLREGCPFGLDELTAPERVAHLAGQRIVVTFAVHADRLVSQLLAALPSLRARRGLGVHGVEVAARGQRIGVGNGVAARRGSRVAAVQRIDQ